MFKEREEYFKKNLQIKPIFIKIRCVIDTSITHIRPRFELTVPLEKQVIFSNIESLLTTYSDKVIGRIVDDHIILDIVHDDVHYWSPQLNFRIESDEENPKQTILSGLIGPRPAVWTMFMFIYFSVGIIGFIISSFGISRWMIGESSALLWAFPIAILFMLTAYRAGKYGEQLGADQVELLKQFIRDAISLKKTN